MAEIAVKLQVIGYLQNMRNDARSYIRMFPMDSDRWEERAEMLEAAVKMLAEAAHAQTT